MVSKVARSAYGLRLDVAAVTVFLVSELIRKIVCFVLRGSRVVLSMWEVH
jgi:hypothetical protein